MNLGERKAAPRRLGNSNRGRARASNEYTPQPWEAQRTLSSGIEYDYASIISESRVSVKRAT